MPQIASLKRSNQVLIGIIILGFLLRIWGISFGLPYLYHPDEPNKILIAQRIFKTCNLNPRYFNKPSLFIYFNAIAYLPYYLLGKLIGVFQTPNDIAGPFMLALGVGRTSMPTTVLLGRLLTVAFGVAAIPIEFLLGRELSDSPVLGLFAALMVSISPTHVVNSHFITSNAFLVFFILLTAWASLRIYYQNTTRYYIMAGIAAGLAISSKYNGGAVVSVILAAHFLRNEWRGLIDLRLYLAFALMLVAFVITTPFAVLDYRSFLRDVLFEARHYVEGHAGMEGNALGWYLSYICRVEGIVGGLALLEILRNLYLRSKQGILIAVFPLTYFAFISSFAVRNDRTLLPLLPFLFLLMSSLLFNLFKQIYALKTNENVQRILSLALAATCIASVILPLRQTLKQDIRLSSVDSRETARVWIARHLPADSKIAIESYSPFVDPKRFSVHAFDGIIEHDPEWYVARSFEYLIFSEGAFGRFYQNRERYASEVDKYEKHFNTFNKIKTFSDGGYEIHIYQVKKTE